MPSADQVIAIGRAMLEAARKPAEDAIARMPVAHTRWLELEAAYEGTAAILARRPSGSPAAQILVEDLERTLPSRAASILSELESQLSSDAHAAFQAALNVAVAGSLAVLRALLGR